MKNLNKRSDIPKESFLYTLSKDLFNNLDSETDLYEYILNEINSNSIFKINIFNFLCNYFNIAYELVDSVDNINTNNFNYKYYTMNSEIKIFYLLSNNKLFPIVKSYTNSNNRRYYHF